MGVQMGGLREREEGAATGEGEGAPPGATVPPPHNSCKSIKC